VEGITGLIDVWSGATIEEGWRAWRENENVKRFRDFPMILA